MENNNTQKEALEMLQKMNIAFSEQNLIYYAQEGDYNKVELLLKAGVNPNKSWRNEKQKKNIYALHNTAGFGEPKMVQLLLDFNADINLLDEKGESALIYAIQNSKIETVKILIEKGANINHKTKDNINPLYVATKKKNTEIISLLKDAGAEEMSAQEIKSYERSQLVVKIITFAIIIGIVWFFVHIGGKNSSGSSSSSSSSNTSSSSGNHTCTWCGKSYSGNGYNHLGGTGSQSYCAEATNGWEKQNQCCSMKCCEEQSRK